MLLEEFDTQLYLETFLQPTEVSSDVQPTQTRDNTYNNSVNVETDILPIPIPSNLSMSEFFPIYEDLSDPTPQPTVMLSDNIHESEDVATTSTRNNGKPSAYQLHNIIVETENKQKFVTTNNDENNEWDVATCSCDWVETTPHKKLKVDNASSIKKPTKKPKPTKKTKPAKKPKTKKKPKPVKKPANNISKKTKNNEILSMNAFIFEHPSDNHFDEYPIKILLPTKAPLHA